MRRTEGENIHRVNAANGGPVLRRQMVSCGAGFTSCPQCAAAAANAPSSWYTMIGALLHSFT